MTPTSRFGRGVVAVAAALVMSARLLAHDLWIEPTTFRPEPGDNVGVKLWVGVNLAGDPLPRVPKYIDQFIVEDRSGRKAVPGRPASDPAGLLRPTAPGLLVVGYNSTASEVDLTADTFNQYLKEEGLDTIAAERARRGQNNAPVHEQFFRCAKSLILSGPPSDAESDRTLGFPLELVAERNPYTTRGDQDLIVRLTYHGKPLAGALVSAVNRAHLTETFAARSDGDGRVKLRLPRGGMWLIKSVHMIPAPPGTNADWVSYWASLTFGSAS